jgi:transcriptional regulator with XRE-family HTH domain
MKQGLNHLYALRRNRGFLQKHLAVLVGHKGTKMLSQYECGRALPPLEIALLLEIVLGARLPELYVDLYQELQVLALTRAQALPLHVRQPLISRLLGKESP